MDNRALNEISIKTPPPSYPPTDIINLKSRGDYVFSFDVSNSFHSLALNPSCTFKTAFWFKGRLYIWRRLVQGYVCSSFHQQNMFNHVFSEKFLEEFRKTHPSFNPTRFKNALLHYSDDFLLFGYNKDREEFLLNVKCIFYCLETNGLKISKRKSHFFATQYTFLGTEVNLSVKTSRVESWKIQAVEAWTRPATKLELISRLATLSYISSYLPCWKILALPLFHITLEGSKWTWTNREEKAWNNIKMLVKLHLSLHVPSPDDHLLVSSDSALCGMSSCLMVFKDRKLSPVAFLSRLYSKNIIRRTILAKEATAAAFALEKFRRLIENSKNLVTFLVDSHALLYTRNYSKTNMAIFNFSLLLQGFNNIQLLSMPGELNLLADIISRWVTSAAPRRYHAEETKGELEEINRNIFHHTSPILYTKEDLLDILNSAPLQELHDINPAGNYERPAPDKNGLQSLEDVLNVAGDPPELAFLRLGADKISEDVRRHQLWSKVKKLKSQRPLTDTDIQTMKKKYRLEDFDLSLYNYVADTVQVGANPDPEEQSGDASINIMDPSKVGETAMVELSPEGYHDKYIEMNPEINMTNVHLCSKTFCHISSQNKQFIKNAETFYESQRSNSEKFLKTLDKSQVQKSSSDEFHIHQFQSDLSESGNQSTAAGPSESPSQNPETDIFHFRPQRASEFVKKMKIILRIMQDRPKLLEALKQYQVSKKSDKIKLYKQCIEYAEGMAKTKNTEWSVFIPSMVHQESHFKLQPGINCLELVLTKPLNLGKHELKLLNIYAFFNIEDRGVNLYLDPCKEIQRKALVHIPDHICLVEKYNYFHKSYIVPHSNLSLPAGTVIYRAYGFLPRFSTLEIEKPECIANDGEFETQVNCGHQQYSGHTGINYALFPIQLQTKIVTPLFDKLKEYFDHETTEQFFAEWVNLNINNIDSDSLGDRTKKEKLGDQSNKKKCKDSTPPDPPSAPPEKKTKKWPKSHKSEILSDPKNSTEEIKLSSSESNPARANNLLYISHILNANRIFAKDCLAYFLSHKDYLEAYNKDGYTKIDGLLYAENKKGSNQQTNLLVLPQEVTVWVLKYLHEELNAHINTQQLKVTFERRYVSLGPVLQLAKKITDSCTTCTFQKVNHNKKDVGTVRTFTPSAAWQILYADFAHSLPLTKSGNSAALILCDALTNFSFLIPVREMTQTEEIRAFGSLMAIFGSPSVLLPDSASSFGGQFSAYLSTWGVFHHRMTPRRSQSVGGAEVSLKNLRHQLSKIISSQPGNRDNWDLLAPAAVRSYNLHPLYKMKEPRASLFFGGDSHLHSNQTCFYSFKPETVSDATKKLSKKRVTQKQKGFQTVFKPGELVSLHRKCKESAIRGTSRYLVDSEQSLFKILDSCPYSALIRNQGTGAVMCVTPSELRRVDLNTDSDVTWPTDARLIDSFKSSRYVAGNQPSFSISPKSLGPAPTFQPLQSRVNNAAAADQEGVRRSKRVQINELINKTY